MRARGEGRDTEREGRKEAEKQVTEEEGIRRKKVHVHDEKAQEY